MTARAAGPRLTIDPWDPAYGVSLDADDSEGLASDVGVDVEVPGAAWAAITPAPLLTAPPVLFVDGVRRVDAHVWVDDGADGPPDGGICASYAAGAVRCAGDAARLVSAEVGRGIFSSSPHASDLPTSAGRFAAHGAAGPLPAQLSLALQQAMAQLERQVAESACGAGAGSGGVVVLDGPLRGKDHMPSAVGLVKTHHVFHLPPAQHRLVADLGAGQRTPLFMLGTSWARYSWYLRLPGGSGAPWAGVVRCECSPAMEPGAARALAELVSAVLPRFASQPHKDPRAPQNLAPIGALERELRRRLGDAALVYRALRAAAAAGGI